MIPMPLVKQATSLLRRSISMQLPLSLVPFPYFMGMKYAVNVFANG
jgi:hypothetical protein